MKAIYASKLYKSSSRKDKIKAALNNPANLELVSQLAEYLDEDYITPENLGLDNNADLAGSSSEANIPDDLDPGLSDDYASSDHLVHVPSSGGGSLPPKPDLSDDDFDLDIDDSESSESGESDSDTSDSSPSTSDNLFEDLDEPVQEATYIKSCNEIDTATLKGSLNSRQDTCGVARMQVKDTENELWIFYNDDINLNNIMTQVIEFLNASGNTYLEFNRLARSDNAMVFQINNRSDNEPIKPVEATEDEGK